MFYAVGMCAVIVVLGLALYGISQFFSKPASREPFIHG